MSVVDVTHSEVHRELRFWAHGGNGVENMGTVMSPYISCFGSALVQFI